MRLSLATVQVIMSPRVFRDARRENALAIFSLEWARQKNPPLQRHLHNHKRYHSAIYDTITGISKMPTVTVKKGGEIGSIKLLNVPGTFKNSTARKCKLWAVSSYVKKAGRDNEKYRSFVRFPNSNQGFLKFSTASCVNFIIIEKF